MAALRPPDYDSKPLYTDGQGVGWVGYGMFFEWPSACFQVFDWKDYWRLDEANSAAAHWKAEHGVVLQGLVEANDKIDKLKRALTANDTMLRVLQDMGLDKSTDEGKRQAFALRMMISANADLLTGETK